MNVRILAALFLLGFSKAVVPVHAAAPNPSPAPATVLAGRPRVLLIGDSISLGYTDAVRRLIGERANVFRIPGNASSSGFGLENLDRWVGDAHWDVIHFNFGLHDAKLPPEGIRHADVDVYERNLRRIVDRLQATGARLIWATTTPIPLGGNLRPTRRFGDIAPYNAAALRVMRENGVAIDDLNAAITPRAGELGVPRDVHYTPEGYEVLAQSVAASIAAALSPQTGLWNLSQLERPPRVDWQPREGQVQPLFYEGERFHGRPTRIFAYLARPAGRGPRKLPAIVLVHGGGGAAFREWAEHWAERGYVALAMDLQGNGEGRKRLTDGGPVLNSANVFLAAEADEALRDGWVYQAVAATVRGISLLASQPEVDSARIALTGISWGGFVTCLTASLDHRIKVAVPVYGSGFLQEDSSWKEKFLDPMTPAQRERWLRLSDPSRYLPSVQCPILFFTGANDSHYYLDTHRRSVLSVRPELRHVCVLPGIKHGHIWTFAEVDRFIEAVIDGRPVPPQVVLETPEADTVVARVLGGERPAKAELLVAPARGPWSEREWRSEPATIDGEMVRAQLPAKRPLDYYFLLTGAEGLHASSVFAEAR